MTQVKFGANGGHGKFGLKDAQSTGALPSVHESPSEYINNLLNQASQGSALSDTQSGHGHKGGNKLIKLAVAGIVGVLAWRMRADKYITKLFGNLSSKLSKVSTQVKNKVGKQLDLPFNK